MEADVHDPLACEFCHTEGYAAEYEAMKAERDALAARVEALEAQRDEALKLLAGALKGHGLAPCTFSRGEMADLEMALHALKHGAQGSSGDGGSA
jgi:hypothetical protein